jgi:hypothetical protein
VDIIENRYRMIIEPERSGKTISGCLHRVWSLESNMVQVEEAI